MDVLDRPSTTDPVFCYHPFQFRYSSEGLRVDCSSRQLRSGSLVTREGSERQCGKLLRDCPCMTAQCGSESLLDCCSLQNFDLKENITLCDVFLVECEKYSVCE